MGEVGAFGELKWLRSGRSLVPPRVLKAMVRGVMGLSPFCRPGVSGIAPVANASSCKASSPGILLVTSPLSLRILFSLRFGGEA